MSRPDCSGRSIQLNARRQPAEKGESKVKLIKMFGLAAIAAIAAMAFVGASSAMAEDTALCTEDSATLACPSGKLVTHVHLETQKLNAAHTALVPAKGTLLTNILNVECVALFLGDVLALGAPQLIHGNLSYSSCTLGCTVTEISSGGLISLLKEGHELGKVTGTGFQVLVECTELLHCVYDGENLVGHALGPLLSTHTGHVTFSDATVHKVSGLLCPETSKLDADFLPLEPTPLYIKG